MAKCCTWHKKIQAKIYVTVWRARTSQTLASLSIWIAFKRTFDIIHTYVESWAKRNAQNCLTQLLLLLFERSQ